jgi:ubiquinone/menaquinone biosynthesis C-methylase UbiE
MSYDWEAAINAEAYSLRWFEEVDRRFVESAKIYSQMNSPFDRFIPFEQLKGKSVLEIGCGMGFHTELLVRAGANVTSIDISPTSVGATRRRLELKGLQARVIEADAEMLPFADNEFSFVWSWGGYSSFQQDCKNRQAHWSSA